VPLLAITDIILCTGMDLRVWFIEGKINIHADMLSRLLVDKYHSKFPADYVDRVTPLSKLRIRFLYTLQTLSEHHNTFLDFISHFHSSFCIFTAHLDLRSLFRKLCTYFGPPNIISETSHLQNLYSHLQISSDHSSGPYTYPLTSFHHCSYSVSHVDMF
jgi:hypothetical protein